MRIFLILILSSTFFLVSSPISKNYLKSAGIPVPKIEFEPEVYTCLFTSDSILIDGKCDDKVWMTADWTNSFVDIEGSLKPEPYLKTRLKMLWDKEYMYFYAEMDEPHLWANLKDRDAVIFYDNDFEIFIDPDGDTHNYYEFEFNLFGTLWDLLLTKPYRDNGQAIDAWDVRGIKYALDLNGTLNDPSDIDRGWSIEVAIPWSALEEAAGHNGHPEDGEYWKVNFSRVQWETDIIDGKYVKKQGIPENNWVWSPQGLIAMHYPEMWGIVDFRIENTKKHADFKLNEDDKWLLRQLYYGMKYFKEKNGYFPKDLNELYKYMNTGSAEFGQPEINIFDSTYTIKMKSTHFKDMNWYIREDGKIWSEYIKGKG